MPGREVFQRLPYPCDDARFPAELGALVQRTVLTGDMPAREVIHAPDGSWAMGDGVNDPNLPDASRATRVAHVIALNSWIADLASMPPRHIARRSRPGEPWTIVVLEGWDDA